MNKIGFKNFRRFVDFKPLEYKDIAFLVGRNNSGKSTLVKALLLIDDYLKNESISSFSFGHLNVEDVNIVTYDRAKNKSAKNEDYITFEYRQDDFGVEITISGKEDRTTVDVIYFHISDYSNNLIFKVEPQNFQITFESLSSTQLRVGVTENNNLLSELQINEKKLKEQLNNIKEKGSQEYININHELKQIRLKIKDLKAIIKKDSIIQWGFSVTSGYSGDSLSEIFEDAIQNINSQYEKYYNEIQEGKKPVKNFEELRAFKENKFIIEKSIENFLQLIRNSRIAYLGATLNKQSALFAIRDKSNALAQAIHEFNQLIITPGEEAYRFVQKWMSEDEFEVGKSFAFKMYAGEAYEVLVNSNGKEIPLADKGMGSIQAMLLIFRLATIIHKKQKDKNQYTIVIEEPELNLHPALQSKLANLFLEVNQKYGIKLIIETHSEYLIRKTQLLVKENEFEVKPNENPFCVLYFDKEDQWQMNYREDGKFIEEFGTGFFDESRKIVKKMM
jgi:predicted ATP-dependent endonuclease of OLD family